MTKYSPNKIIFGHDLNYNINPSPSFTTTTSSTNQYIKYMDNTRNIIQNKAIASQSNYDHIRSKSYNRNRSPAHKYEVGDLVLINISRRTTENQSKLNPTWHGPHEIIHIIIPDKVFKISEVGNETHTQQINIKLIKPYKASPYIMTMNYIMDNPHIQSNHINQYIQYRKLTPNLLKSLTPSSKKRQL